MNEGAGGADVPQALFYRAAQALFTEKTQNYAIFFTNRVYFILWNKEKLQ